MSALGGGGEATAGAPAPLPSGISVQELKHITALRMAKHQELQRQAQHQAFRGGNPYAHARGPPEQSAGSPELRTRTLGGAAAAMNPSAASVTGQAAAAGGPPMTGMAEPPSDLQSTVAVGQQGMGTAGPTASAPGGPMVPPMPHGLTVQELKELTRMRLARERIAGYHAGPSYPAGKVNMNGDSAALQGPPRGAMVYPVPPPVVEPALAAASATDPAMRPPYLIDHPTAAAASASASALSAMDLHVSDHAVSAAAAAVASSAARRMSTTVPAVVDPMVAAAAAAAAAAGTRGGWAGIVKGSGPVRVGGLDQLPMPQQKEMEAALKAAEAGNRAAAVPRILPPRAAANGPAPTAATAAEAPASQQPPQQPQRKERPQVRLSIQPPRPDEVLPPLALRGRSLSSTSVTSVDSEDLPYQMAEYVLLTPKSPASPHLGRVLSNSDPFLGGPGGPRVTPTSSAKKKQAAAAAAAQPASRQARAAAPSAAGAPPAPNGDSRGSAATTTSSSSSRSSWFFGGADGEEDEEGEESRPEDRTGEDFEDGETAEDEADEDEQRSASGDKEGEGLAAGSGSEDDLTFYNAASSTGGSAASCYTTVAADSSEEEAENGPTTSPAGYTDDLSPTARQLARVMEICGTCATDKLGADPDNGGSLLMRMAPQGPAKGALLGAPQH